jgi:hypothetical protein
VIEATSTGGRRSDFLQQKKSAPGNLRLLQQHLPTADLDGSAARARAPSKFFLSLSNSI